jgi:hypothetical protein
MKASPDESLRQAVLPKRARRQKREVDVRSASRQALLKVLEPLAGLVLEAGLSIQDVHALLRIAAVKSVAAQQREAAKRVNISGIAASTGIPRAEVSRILKGSKAEDPSFKPRIQSTYRILAAWRDDPRFTTPNGQPADLKIYGKGATFETLVKEYGRGIPARAVLDEFARAGAVDMRPAQSVRLKTAMTIDGGLTSSAIRSFGDRLAELAETLLRNMRYPESPFYVSHMSESKILRENLPLIRKELATKGFELLAGLQDVLAPPRHGKRGIRSTDAAKLAVTIFCHESPHYATPTMDVDSKRVNLRRDSGRDG